jgi:hypothetical protein
MRCFIFLLFAVCATAAPYVLPGADQTNFTLCLGSPPSSLLKKSLLMCRELSYEFCVNSSLIGSVLSEDGVTARHFLASAAQPTEANIEKLAWLVDSALVLLYDAFSAQRAKPIECAHEWRAWVCSRAFKRAANTSAEPPLPLCPSTCHRVQNACNTEMNCPPKQPEHFQCTDFYRDSSSGGCGGAASHRISARNVPVFKGRRDAGLDGTSDHSSAHRISSIYSTAVAVSLLIGINCIR